MILRSAFVLMFCLAVLLMSADRVFSQPPSMQSSQDRMNEMRQRMDKQMEESRQRHDDMVNDMRSRMGNPESSSASSTDSTSTVRTLRPYRRIIRWGIGALVLGGIALWKMATGGNA